MDTSRNGGAALQAASFLMLVVPMLAQQPVRLQVENRVDPVGIDVTTPRLSWTAATQYAYQVRAATDAAELWDSGMVVSSQSTGVVYGGAALLSRMRVSWQVRVWTVSGPGPVTLERPGVVGDGSTECVGLVGTVDRQCELDLRATSADLRAPVHSRETGQQRPPVHYRIGSLPGHYERPASHGGCPGAGQHEVRHAGRIRDLRCYVDSSRRERTPSECNWATALTTRL